VTFVQEGYFVAFHGFLAVDENGLPSKTTFLPTILSWNMGNAFSGRGNLLLEVVWHQVWFTGRFRKHGLNKKDGQTEAIYTKVPKDLEGKSTARQVESSVLKRMEKEGFPLASTADTKGERGRRS